MYQGVTAASGKLVVVDSGEVDLGVEVGVRVYVLDLMSVGA